MPKVVVTVNPDGSTRLDFVGYEGLTCLDAGHQLKALLASFGVETEQTNFTAKPELQQEQELHYHPQKQTEEA